MLRVISSIGLRTRYILIGIAVLIPLIAVMLQLAQYERDTALANAEQRVDLLASLTAERQYQLVQRIQIVLRELSNQLQARGSSEGCTEFFAAARATNPWMAAIRLSRSDGSGVCADRPEVLGYDISDRGYFGAVVAGEAFAISDQFTSREAGQPIVVAAVPVSGVEGSTGVLAALVDLDDLADLLPIELRSDPAMVVNLIDGNGVLLARHPPDPKLVGQLDPNEPIVRRALQEPSGTAELPDLKGTVRLFAFQKVETVDWVAAVGISRDAVFGPVKTALQKRLGLIGAIVLGSCIIGLAGGELLVFWPLRVLARTAQALERGDMASRALLTGLSEVGNLERSLNRMAEAIQQRESDLQVSQAAGEQAARDAKQANEARGRVLASMSHEIRTPLGSIIGYNDLLLGQDLQPRQRLYAERIEAAAASMISVIDGFLDIERIEAREVEIEHRPFALPSMVDNAVSMVRASAERKGLALTVELDPELPPAVLGDETRLRQVLLNLLTNAVKFTSRGSVTFAVRHAEGDGRIRFSIRDSGIGIAEAQHHRLFKRFSQAHDAIDRHYGGTGLGLAICKELTELMGGVLGFSSEADRGSTFWVELALPQVDAASLRQRSAPVPSLAAGRILVVDDYEMSREMTSAMLIQAGHKVDVVASGAQAVEAVCRKPYDLVLMDIEMRGMGGMVAIERIRQLQAPARRVPVIAMTANVLPKQVRAFMDAGMDDHLGKPFTRNDLIAKVNLFLSPVEAAVGGVAMLSARAAVFDKKALAEMRILLGEQRIAAWLESLRTQIEAIISIDDKPVSRHKLAKIAHTLVQAGSLGFTKLSRLSSELDAACVNRIDYAASLVQVKKACREALRTIDRLQNGKAVKTARAN